MPDDRHFYKGEGVMCEECGHTPSSRMHFNSMQDYNRWLTVTPHLAQFFTHCTCCKIGFREGDIYIRLPDQVKCEDCFEHVKECRNVTPISNDPELNTVWKRFQAVLNACFKG